MIYILLSLLDDLNNPFAIQGWFINVWIMFDRF